LYKPSHQLNPQGTELDEENKFVLVWQSHNQVSVGSGRDVFLRLSDDLFPICSDFSFYSNYPTGNEIDFAAKATDPNDTPSTLKIKLKTITAGLKVTQTNLDATADVQYSLNGVDGLKYVPDGN